MIFAGPLVPAPVSHRGPTASTYEAPPGSRRLLSLSANSLDDTFVKPIGDRILLFAGPVVPPGPAYVSLAAHPLDTVGNGPRNKLASMLGVSSFSRTVLREIILELYFDKFDGRGQTGPRPVGLSRDQEARLFVDGTEFLRRRIGADDTVFFPAIKAGLRDKYRHIRQMVLDGNAPPDWHRRWLGVMKRRFRSIDVEHWRDEAYQSDGPALDPQTERADTFNVSAVNDGDQITHASYDGGMRWEQSGDYEITGSQTQVKNGTHADAHARGTSSYLMDDDEHYAQSEWVTVGSGGRWGVATRIGSGGWGGGSVEHYQGWVNASGNTAQIHEWDNSGSDAALGSSSSYTPSNGDYIRLRSNASDEHELFVDNFVDPTTSRNGPFTDTTLNGRVRIGLSMYGAWGDVGDNFKADGLGGAAASPNTMLLLGVG